jgi:hypothetical protein
VTGFDENLKVVEVEIALVGRGVILSQAGLAGRLSEEEGCQEGDQAGRLAGHLADHFAGRVTGRLAGHTKVLNLDVKRVY